MESGRFELHSHSYYSKGKQIPCEALVSPCDAIKTAKKKGLSGIVLSDHDTIAGWKEASEEAKKQGILFIPGLEVSTKEGHIIGLGLSDSIKPGLTVEETVDKIREQGGISIAAHPFDIRGLGIGNMLDKTDAVEVFNTMSMDRISNILAERKAKKLGMPVTASSDAHTAEMIGASLTIMDAYDIDSVIREIMNKRVELVKRYLPMKIFVDWTRERMARSYDDIVQHIKDNYSAPKAWVSKALLHKFLFSKHPSVYNNVARFGATCSVFYSGVRMLWYL